MEETIHISFDSQSSPRTTDDILFDLPTTVISEPTVDPEDGLVLPTETSNKLDTEVINTVQNNSNDVRLEEKDITDKETISELNDLEPAALSINNTNINACGGTDLSSIPVLTNDNGIKYSDDGQNGCIDGDHREQMDEFSSVLGSKDERVSNTDGFTSILTAEEKLEDGTELERENEEDEDIDLDKINIQEKVQESDSGSEFDFELPTAKPAQTTVQNNPPVLIASSLTVKNEENQVEKEEHSELVQTAAQFKPAPVTEEKDKKTEVEEPKSPSNGNERVLEAARNEWDNVTTIQAGYVAGNTEGSEPTVVETLTPMSPYELIQILKEEDFTSVKSSIKVHIERKGIAAFVNFLFGPPKLKRQLMDERERIFCVAATQLNNENPSHLRTLQTIYRSLTGSKFDCPRFGSHWDEVGFQGTDPATDLRSVGILGLLNLLYLLKNPKTLTLASDIYRLSLHPTQNFPFCVMGINLTRITLQVLREDILNKECNKRGEVLEVFCEFYTGLYLLLYQVWKGQGKTISDSGFVIKDIEMKARKSSSDILKNLDEFLNRKKVIVTDVSPGIETDNLEFVNVCDNS